MAETVRIEIPIETIDETEDGVNSAIQGIKKLDQAFKNTGQSVSRADRAVSQFDRQARKTERSLANWAREKHEVLLEAKDRITPILSTLGNHLKSFAGKTWSITMRAIDLVTSPVRGIINLLKNPVLQMGAVLGVSIGMKDTVETYKDFEAAMSQVQAISGATGSEVVKLTNKAKEMGATTKYTAEESAQAMNYMAMAGWKTGEMLDGIGGIMSLAAASGEDLATTSDIVTDSLTAFNMKASEAGRFSDVLAAAASGANTTVSGMGETFKYAGAMAGSLGYSIEDVALMTGLMANAGIKASMSGTALNSIFTRLSTNTSGAADALSDLGIEFFTSEGNARDLSDVMGELRKATADMSAEQKSQIANTIAGTEAQKGLLAILNASETDYNKLADAINNADGAAAKMSETMMDNLQGSITLLQSAVDGVKISFGERLSPYVRNLADWLTAQMPEVEQGLNEFMDWLDVKIDKMQRKFNEIAESKEWQDADFFGKVKIAWDEFIAEPFSEWWNSTGKAKFAGFAQDIGSGIGTGLKLGIMTLLGIDIGETLDEGVSIGASFAKGFSEGFDFEAITGKLQKGFGNLLSSAGKFLPGGEAPDLSSLMAAVTVGKVASPFISMGKGAFSLGKTIFGKSAGGTSLAGNLGTTLMGSAAGGTGLKGLGATMGMLGMNLGSGATTGAGLIAAGTAATAGGIAGGATLISGAIDAYKAFKSDDKGESKAYGESATWKAGGVAAGAAAGAAIGSIIPGIGTAVGALAGAGIGGIAGWIKGNKVKEEYQQNVEEMQLKADKAQKVFDATGFSIDKVKFETEALNKAINDTEVSAGQLGIMFQEAVGDNLKSHFGDIKLSLTEIKDVAKSIVFDGQVQSAEDFSRAMKASESSLATLKDTVQNVDKMNWKASLGFALSDVDVDNFKTSVDSMVSEAKAYIEDKHYEATLAIDLLVGSENSGGLTGSLNAVYGNLQSQLDEAGAELQRAVSAALADGVISTEDTIKVNIGGIEYEMDEASAISELQNKILEITDKVSSAQEEAQLQSLKIRYGGAELDAESFAQLQEELQANVESLMSNYNEALEVSLTNLNLQLDEGAIDESEYKAQLQQLTEGYEANVNDLQVRVESFQLDTIAEAYGSALDGILPDLEGTTSEKLSQVMQNALASNPAPAEWSAEQISSWFGLESLSAETQTAVSELLRATAETIPESLQSSITEAMSAVDYSGVDFVGPISNAYYEQLTSMDMTEGANILAQNIQNGVSTSFGSMDFSAAGTAVSDGVGSAIQNADMGQINSAISSLKSNTDSSVNSAFGAGVSTTMPVNITLDYNILNPTKTISVSGKGASGSTSVTVNAHAAGGYVSGGPQLSWLAEEGYGEFVIPTNPSRRTRALDLYEQAGKVLGVTAHAAGGYVGSDNFRNTFTGYNFFDGIVKNASVAYNEITEGISDNGEAQSYSPTSTSVENAGNSSGVPVQLNVKVEPEFVIHGGDGQSEEGIMQVIRRHMKEMADELGGEIAGKLEEVFSNMPLTEA